MSEHHSEISGYIANSDAQTIAKHVIALCQREGMRLAALPALGCQTGDARLPEGLMRVGIFPGAFGWHLLLVDNTEFFCERPNPNESIRFVSLCDGLDVPGLLVDCQYNSYTTICGDVLLEADGKGSFALSGYRWESSQTSEEEMFCWRGNWIDEIHAKAEPRLIIPALPSKPGLIEAGQGLQSNHAELCAEFASRLGGEISRYWQGDTIEPWGLLESAMFLGGPSPVEGSVLLTFERPAAAQIKASEISRDWRQSPHDDAFWGSLPFRYATGEEIRLGDEVRWNKGDRGVVRRLYATNGPNGLIPGGVEVGNILGVWMVTLGAIANLVLVGRDALHAADSAPEMSTALLHELADVGDAESQYRKGLLHVAGKGVQQNPFLANALFRQASMQGHPRAQYELGYSYCKSRGILFDETEAVHWLRLAGEKGVADALLCLMSLNVYRDGTPKNPEAVLWMTRAAETGNELAQFLLANCYARGMRVAQSFERAVHWYRCAAGQGHWFAQYQLGLCLEHGLGIEQDYMQAVNWYRKAAEGGIAAAQCNMADKYENGLGVTQDLQMAVAWYRKAADQGVKEAQYSLGVLYRDGRGVELDVEQARTWFEMSARLGYADAEEALKGLP